MISIDIIISIDQLDNMLLAINDSLARLVKYTHLPRCFLA